MFVKFNHFVKMAEGDTGGTGSVIISDPGTPPAGTPPAGTPPAGTPPAGTPPAGEPTPKPLGDWAALRTEIAAGDDKILKRLERYSSPKDVADALIAAQNKIAAGGAKGALPADATPEQLTEWRKDNGIPEKAEGYTFKLDGGLAVGATDQPIVDGFLKTAHELNMPPAQVEKTLNWYFHEQERQLEVRQQQDAQLREKGVEQLRTDWGSEYKLNLGIIDGLLNQAPAGVKEGLLGARLADGSPVGNDPNVLRWLATIGREMNPTSTVTTATGIAATQAIEGEKAQLNKLMGDHNSAYWKGPEAQHMQARYRELLDVESKMRN